MAEIGLVASVVTLAAAGTSIATSLYQAADVITHANEQIYALAKHVTQFTAVLKHMAQVLKEERKNCSKEVLRDIRKIKHSCKRTFKEIESTLKSQRFRHFGPVRWMFKRTKALELQARLDSQQSMLQCIIHTLTVSKLGHMDSRSKQDSEHISGLKIEINLLKTFIMESYRSLTELRHAENSAAAESKLSSPSPDDPQSPLSAFEGEDEESSSDDDEIKESDVDANGDEEDDDRNHFVVKSEKEDHAISQPNSQQQLSRISLAPQASKHDEHRESSMLLQMVPYRPKVQTSIRQDRLIQNGQDSEGNVQSTGEGAIESVRLLLDKWTATGSGPFSEVLDNEVASEGKELALLVEGHTTGAPLESSPYPTPFDEFDAYGNNMRPQGPIPYGYRGKDLIEHPVRPPLSAMQQRDLWRPLYPPERYRHIGNEILMAMRSTRGGIYYAKTSPHKQVFFVDGSPIYTCLFVPEELIPDGEADIFRTTELIDGIVRRGALNLLGYVYADVEFGKFAIEADLEFSDIEQLVDLSFQALDRQHRMYSKDVIAERGWNENIEDLRRTTRSPAAMPSRPHLNSDYRHKIAAQPGRSSHYPIPSSGIESPMRPGYFEPSPIVSNWASETEASPSREGGPEKRGPMDRVNPEVRFTVPGTGLVSSPSEKVKRSSAKRPKAHAQPSTDSELIQAHQKLARLMQKKEDAEQAKDLQTASDLQYYSIPDLKNQIKELEKRRQKISITSKGDSDEDADTSDHQKNFSSVGADPSNTYDTFFRRPQSPSFSERNDWDQQRPAEGNEEASRQAGVEAVNKEDERPKEDPRSLEERGRQLDERMRRLDEDEARQARLKGYRQKPAAAAGTRNSTKKKPQQAQVESHQQARLRNVYV